MFWPDVIELKSFYASAVGQVACQILRRRIHTIWQEAKGETLLGVGYALPYLYAFLEKSDVVIACMPAGQGIVHWPVGADNQAVLVDEGELPFSTGTVNRLFLIHALEHSEQVRQMLQEAHRVLTPSGRLCVIVPNRHGIWARSPASPFAQGQSFSIGQLRRILLEAQFTTLQMQTALFFPPVEWRFILRSARVIESIASRFCAGFGGVIIAEAEKQIYAPISGKRYPAVKGLRARVATPAIASPQTLPQEEHPS
jgi:SAM-dependent methyltransferase